MAKKRRANALVMAARFKKLATFKVGTLFNQGLKVIRSEPVSKGSGKSQGWFVYCLCLHCQCKKWIKATELRFGKRKSCGCKRVHLKDLRGQKFGCLSPIKPVKYGKGVKTIVYWACKCDCGSKKLYFINGQSLKNGKDPHCDYCLGTKTKDRFKEMWSGKKLHRLVVQQPADRKAHRFWCTCYNCGKRVRVSYLALRDGTIKSCGAIACRPTTKQFNIAGAMLTYEEIEEAFNVERGTFRIRLKKGDSPLKAVRPVTH